jgi:membrane protein
MRVLKLLKSTAVEWDRREAARMGASLAFYSLLSMAPLLVLVVGICALRFGPARAQAQLLDQFRQMVGDQGARMLEVILKSTQHPAAGIIANVVGLGTLLFGASGVLIELRTALNHLWGVRPPEWSSGIRGIVKDRFLSFGMVLGIGFLLLVSLSISAALSTISNFVSSFTSLPPTFWETVNFLVSVAVVTGMFSLIFRFVPDTRLPWNSILKGAMVTALLFTLGKTAIGLYLGKAGVGSAYGAAGSLVVLIVWVYYSAQIFYFGAIFTHLYAMLHEPGRLPNQAATETAFYKADSR